MTTTKPTTRTPTRAAGDVPELEPPGPGRPAAPPSAPLDLTAVTPPDAARRSSRKLLGGPDLSTGERFMLAQEQPPQGATPPAGTAPAPEPPAPRPHRPRPSGGFTAATTHPTVAANQGFRWPAWGEWQVGGTHAATVGGPNHNRSPDDRERHVRRGDPYHDDEKNQVALDYGPGAYGTGTTLAEYDAAVLRLAQVDTTLAHGVWGQLDAKGEVRVLSARGRVYSVTDLGRDGLNLGIGAQARAELIGATYQLDYQKQVATWGGQPVTARGNVTADAFVGAQGDTSAVVQLNRKPNVTVGAGGFAGAAASTSAQGTVGGVGGQGGASGWLGVGAKAEGKLTFENGKFHLGGQVGAALGIGGSTNVDIAINFNDVAALGVGTWNESKPVLNTIGKGTAGAAKAASKWTQGAAKSTGKGITKAAKSTGKGITKAAKSVGKGLKKAGKSIKKAFKGW